ncbi:peptide chain release factor N(5)-glutamine methyltransferase [Aliiruegeria sabulilitoris]|uniref:peptide chain release factor N(5)-glutamine methyltransferase n=1 Tax=Aliiruegeria sabulilitoris TaxID=1510458 RepID=UPI000835B985|nr:peptide chain release factor N(5)-glutamine methyltransferase [Aliiruegeria sabulilitoris]NDR57196.1 peptide chain release factor N(5)-glutamine methyltransferase [Pseudoruegeria sp. M32A2M]
MTFAEALAVAVDRLKQAGVETPQRDARLLVAFAGAISPDRLTLHLRDSFEGDAALAAALDARAARQPVSHITGNRLFWGHNFHITAEVLDPRPETETLIAAALQAPFERVLDLGTGSGCILLSLLAERPQATGLGVDLSEKALEVARQNAADLGVPAEFRRSDWYETVTGRFDLIVSNPPYIAVGEMAGLAPETRDWEPRVALTDEGDGLSCYQIIAARAADHLSPNGRLLVEIGASQGDAVSAIFAASGFEDIHVLPDLDGRDRVVAARLRTSKS